jgi:hypothetical protein
MNYDSPGKSAAVALLVFALAAASGACRDQGKTSPTSAAASTAAPPHELPAGQDVLDLLGGLAVGQVIEGFEIKRIGAVRADGLIPIEVQNVRGLVLLVVGLAPSETPAPAETDKYCVYWLRAGDHPAPPDDQVRLLAKAIAERIEKVEDKVPTPKGMKPLGRHKGIPA